MIPVRIITMETQTCPVGNVNLAAVTTILTSLVPETVTLKLENVFSVCSIQREIIVSSAKEGSTEMP